MPCQKMYNIQIFLLFILCSTLVSVCFFFLFEFYALNDTEKNSTRSFTQLLSKTWDKWTSWKLFNILKNLKYFCGKKYAFDCAGIRAQVFRLHCNNLCYTFWNITLHFKSLPNCDSSFNIWYVPNYYNNSMYSQVRNSISKCFFIWMNLYPKINKFLIK